MSRRHRSQKSARQNASRHGSSKKYCEDDDDDDTDSVVIEEVPENELLAKLRRDVRSHDEVESTFAATINSIEQKYHFHIHPFSASFILSIDALVRSSLVLLLLLMVLL